jgi:hypothetical protein
VRRRGVRCLLNRSVRKTVEEARKFNVRVSSEQRDLDYEVATPRTISIR